MKKFKVVVVVDYEEIVEAEDEDEALDFVISNLDYDVLRVTEITEEEEEEVYDNGDTSDSHPDQMSL